MQKILYILPINIVVLDEYTHYMGCLEWVLYKPDTELDQYVSKPVGGFGNEAGQLIYSLNCLLIIR